jgi:hypothetical protein
MGQPLQHLSTLTQLPYGWCTMDDKAQNDTSPAPKRGLHFWLVILSLATCIFISALELVRFPKWLLMQLQVHNTSLEWSGYSSTCHRQRIAWIPVCVGRLRVRTCCHRFSTH